MADQSKQTSSAHVGEDEARLLARRGSSLGVKQDRRKVAVEPMQFLDLTPTESADQHFDMNFVEDVDLAVVAEIGSTKLTLGQLMELKVGQVIGLNKLAGEPSDIYVNGHPIAKAEVIVLDENFGLRIQEIVPVTERIRNR